MDDTLITRSEVIVDGRSLLQLTSGRRTSLPPIVMVPGLGYRELLFPWMRELSTWTHVTLLDLPGWHRHRAAACEPTVTGVAEAVADWLRGADAPPPILVGHSTGAQAALRSAVAVPDHLEAVVLAGPTLDPAARHWPQLIARYCRPLWREPPAELAAVRRSLVAGRISPVIELIESAMVDRPEDLVTQLSVPAMILAGQHDRVAPPAWCRRLADLGRARLRTLPGGHNFCFPQAVLADQAVREAVRNRWSS